MCFKDGLPSSVSEKLLMWVNLPHAALSRIGVQEKQGGNGKAPGMPRGTGRRTHKKYLSKRDIENSAVTNTPKTNLIKNR